MGREEKLKWVTSELRKCKGSELDGDALTQTWGAMQEGPSRLRQDSQKLIYLPA